MQKILEKSAVGNVADFHRACSVTASYKPPMLVTRVRLPACADFSEGVPLPFAPGLAG